MLLVPVFFVSSGLGPALDRPPPGWPISPFVCSKCIRVIAEGLAHRLASLLQYVAPDFPVLMLLEHDIFKQVH